MCAMEDARRSDDRQENFLVGQRVFAKIKGYQAWPAMVTSLGSERGCKYSVLFYGTQQTGKVKRSQMWMYNKSNAERFCTDKAKRRADFMKGLRQMEQEDDFLENVDACKLKKVRVALKNNAPGGRTLKNRAANVPKKHSIKFKAGRSRTKIGGDLAKKHVRKGGKDLNTKKILKNEGSLSSEKAGKTERTSEGGLRAVKWKKKSRESESGLSLHFLAKQELGSKGKGESANKYSSTTIGKKRKGKSPGNLILNCVPTSPGKPFHGRTWLPVGEGEVQVSTLQILKIHLNR